METFRVIRDELFAGCFDKVFRTLTTDNGSEFARFPELEEGSTLRFLLCAPVLLGRQGDKRGPQRAVSPVPPKMEMHERLPGRPYSACPAMGKHLATKDSRISKPRSVLPRRASAKIGFLIGLLGVQVIIAIRVKKRVCAHPIHIHGCLSQISMNHPIVRQPAFVSYSRALSTAQTKAFAFSVTPA